AEQLIAAGSFNPTFYEEYIASFNGTSWTPLSQTASNPQVYALAPFGGRLVGAGNFSIASSAGTSISKIASWDGRSLSPLGTGMNAPVRSLKTYNTGFPSNQTFHLVAGGEFTMAGGVSANRIAIWSENNFGPVTPWSALGLG